MKLFKAHTVIAFALAVPFAAPVMAGDQASQTSDFSKRKITSGFSSLDKNGDDKISREEAGNKTIGNYFVTIDANSDDAITQDELGKFANRYPSLVDENAVEEAE